MTPERARDMVRFDSDALARVLEAIGTVPADGLATEVGQRLTAVFAHVCQARLVWLDRILGQSWEGGSIFPPAETLAVLRRRHADASSRWERYAESLTASEIERQLPYRSTEGSGWSSTVEDILLHLFGHSLYHRGQMAHWLARFGATAPATDYIFWTRSSRGVR